MEANNLLRTIEAEERRYRSGDPGLPFPLHTYDPAVNAGVTKETSSSWKIARATYICGPTSDQTRNRPWMSARPVVTNRDKSQYPQINAHHQGRFPGSHSRAKFFAQNRVQHQTALYHCTTPLVTCINISSRLLVDSAKETTGIPLPTTAVRIRLKSSSSPPKGT